MNTVFMKKIKVMMVIYQVSVSFILHKYTFLLLEMSSKHCLHYFLAFFYSLHIQVHSLYDLLLIWYFLLRFFILKSLRSFRRHNTLFMFSLKNVFKFVWQKEMMRKEDDAKWKHCMKALREIDKKLKLPVLVGPLSAIHPFSHPSTF